MKQRRLGGQGLTVSEIGYGAMGISTFYGPSDQEEGVAAMALKIANNLVTWTQLMVDCQAARLATHFGVHCEVLEKVMKANGNLTPPMESVLEARHAIAPGTNPDYDALMASQAGIGSNDLELAAECGRLAGLDMAMALEMNKLVRPTFVRS